MENPHKLDLLISHDLIWCSTEIFDIDQNIDHYTRNKVTVRYLDEQKERATFRLYKIPNGCYWYSIPLVELNGMLTNESGNQTRITAHATVNQKGLGCTIAGFIFIPLSIFAMEELSQISIALRMGISIVLIGLAFVLTYFWIEYQKRQLLKLITQALLHP